MVFYEHLNNSFIKSSHLKNALLIYKQCSHKDDVKRLSKIIESIRLVQPYQEFSFSQDVTGIVKPILDEIKGKNFIESLKVLLNSINIFPSKKDAFTFVNNNIKNSLLSTIFISIYDEYGRVVKNISTEEEHLNFQALDYLYNLEGFNYSIIINAINLINSENSYTINDIENLVSYSPIISKDKVKIISRGIYAFLINDFMSAAYFLILQFEDILRFILFQTEVITVFKNREIEENLIKIDYLLDKCLEHKIFDENIVWFFKSYLTDKQKNLRNLIAHGMFSNYASQDIGIVCYAITWLILRPIFNR